MDEKEFKTKLVQAESMRRHSDRPGYYEGYIWGLRRRYYGPHFGSLEQHEKWLSLTYDRDQTKAEAGRGYRDGLQGFGPHR